MTLKRYSNWPTKVTQNYLKLIRINPQVLLKLIHNDYSNLIKICQNWSTNVPQVDPQTLLKSTIISENWETNVTQNYLKLLKIDPNTLLKLFPKGYPKLLKISSNWSTKITQIDPHTSLNFTWNWSKLIHKRYWNSSKNIIQN